MSDEKQINNEGVIKRKKYRHSIVDKVIFIFLATIAVGVFIWDILQEFIPEEYWQLKLLVMIVGALSGFFSVLSFLWDKKFLYNAEIIQESEVDSKNNVVTLIGDFKNSIVDKIYKSEDNVKKELAEIKKFVSYSGDLAKILSSQEDRRIAFARRRIAELDDSLTYVANAHESDRLAVSIYYAELHNLKNQLYKDGNFLDCSIWAMTGFSDDEWSDDSNDLEKYWCDALVELTSKVRTKRICIINNKLRQLLVKNQDFYNQQLRDWEDNEEHTELIAEKGLKSFIDYLDTYYTRATNHFKIESFCVLGTSQQYKKLIEARGYFGICLSNQKKYVIKGEAVDIRTGLQGQYVFDENSVNELYNIHMQACDSCSDLLEFIKKNSSKDFISFCINRGINIE